jgi:hypothetical protein
MSEHVHKWKEDEMFAKGIFTLVSGTIDDMGEETRVYCEECGKVDYVPKNVLTRWSALDVIKEEDDEEKK